MHWRKKWQPTPVFLPENSRDGGAWDLGVAFQTHPGRQAFISSGSKEPRSALESRRVYCVFSLFLVSLAKSLSILFVFQKKSPGFIDLFFCLLIFYFPSYYLYYSLPFADFGFVLFLILLGGWLGYLFEIFLFSWGRPTTLQTFLLAFFCCIP